MASQGAAPVPRMRKRRGLLSFIRLGFQTSATLSAATVAAVVLGTGSALLGVWAAGAAVGRIPAAVAGGPGSPAAHAALAWTVLSACCFVFQRAAGAAAGAAGTALAARVDAALQRQLMDAVMRPSGIAHLEDPRTLDLISVGRSTFRGSGVRPGRVATASGGLLAGYLALAGSCIILGRFQPLLGLALAATGAWAAYEYKLASRTEAAHHYGNSEGARRTEYLYELGVSPPAAKEVRVLGLPGFLRSRYGEVWRQSMTGVLAPGSPRSAVATALLGLAALTAVVLICRSALDGRIGLGAAAAYVQVVMLVPLAVQQASWTGLQTELGLASLNRYGDAVRAVVEPAPAPAAVPARPADGLPRSAIRFEGLTFTYPGAATPALRALDLEIPAGQSLAIVGVNGAGKSTLIKLLCRLYEPTAGRITVDGIDLPAIDPAGWRARIATVFQDPTRFPASARTNVEYGRLDARGDESGLSAAARTATAADLVAGLPRGWDTILSAEYADGVDLSGGEWQKLALARAFFAVDHGAGVLILDEPAAHLDARAEAHLYERFLALTHGLTTVVISHRFSTVRQASSIVVMDGGGIVEQGTHDELTARGGEYATMFRLQAARFAGHLAQEGVE
jgi:ATP-binding cassette subfamily B protein